MKEKEERDSALVRVDGSDKELVKQISRQTGVTQRSVIHSILGAFDFAAEYGYVELMTSSFSPEVRAKVRDYIENRGRPKAAQKEFEKEEKIRRLVAYRDTLLAGAAKVDELIAEELKK